MREVVSEHQPNLLPALERLSNGIATTKQERHDLIALAIEELMRTGFLDTDESVKRGLMFEKFADFLGDMKSDE